MLKRLSGEVDLLESYSLSLADLVQEKFGRSRELTSVLDKVVESSQIMREVCNATNLNVSQDKRTQRQVRYERLRDSFVNLIKKY
jgi:hypothetical protein